MANYHINRKGEPAICTATINPCPIGGKHYKSEEAALEGIKEEHRMFTPQTKKAIKKAAVIGGAGLAIAGVGAGVFTGISAYEDHEQARYDNAVSIGNNTYGAISVQQRSNLSGMTFKATVTNKDLSKTELGKCVKKVPNWGSTHYTCKSSDGKIVVTAQKTGKSGRWKNVHMSITDAKSGATQKFDYKKGGVGDGDLDNYMYIPKSTVKN